MHVRSLKKQDHINDLVSEADVRELFDMETAYSETLPMYDASVRTRIPVEPSFSKYRLLTGSDKAMQNLLYGMTPANYCETTGENPSGC